jgi:hypothetical protein
MSPRKGVATAAAQVEVPCRCENSTVCMLLPDYAQPDDVVDTLHIEMIDYKI